ncbi:MAG TPA: MBL fold metallo-hydrolase [Mycobacteriales bacterium]|nr:MBL fold metallo-hydrolase [Mycobacteriales bacterium]
MPVVEVAPGVFRAGSRFVNWYLVDGDDQGVTLVDAGLPGYRAQLDPALRTIGKSRADVRALVLTHGHIDHVGFSDVLAAEGASVHLHPADVQLAADWRSNQTQRPLTRYMHLPGTWVFLAHCLANGVTKPRSMPTTVSLQDSETADVPGRPRVIHAPGHTDGSVVLDFQDHGVVFVGDLLCTLSMGSGRRATPRLQSRGSNKNSDQALDSLRRLDGITSRVVLPGHGNPWTNGVEAAADSARAVGCY